MFKPLHQKYSECDFFEMAATSLAFEGGRVVGHRFIPDPGYKFERDSKNEKAIFLRKGSNETGIICICAVEGGGCRPEIVDHTGSGGREFLHCVPDEGCGSSGLLCFLEFTFDDGRKLVAKA